MPAIATPRISYPRLLYGEFHAWVMALAVLDLGLTWILLGLGADEMNVVARAVIQWGGLAALAALKGSGTAVVLAICEYIGHEREALGRRVLGCALAANTAAVAMGTVILTMYASSAWWGV